MRRSPAAQRPASDRRPDARARPSATRTWSARRSSTTSSSALRAGRRVPLAGGPTLARVAAELCDERVRRPEARACEAAQRWCGWPSCAGRRTCLAVRRSRGDQAARGGEHVRPDGPIVELRGPANSDARLRCR